MVRKTDPQVTAPSGNGADPTTTAEVRPPELVRLIERVDRLLREGEPRKALDLLARSKEGSPWSVNATGVCLLRLGDAPRAIELFRHLVLAPGGLVLKSDVPTAFKVNFATALLLDGNLTGCTSVLGEIREEQHPAVQKLRAAIRRW